ncbi:uncharacterized protein PG998_007860 [Apiospora kogelbergensis]|uniref:uncharacterized protein n=1 Tax=Apiospora kogelbergensis TaxID=1337665 RepID=UPI0031312E09
MRFLGSLAIFLATAQAAVTADNIITTLNAFKDAATELQDDGRQVDAESCVSFEKDQGPLSVCVKTFDSAVQQLTEFAGSLGGSPDYCAGPQANDILEAYAGFVDAHQRLFNILSHKAAEIAEVRKNIYPAAGGAVVTSLTDVKRIATECPKTQSRGQVSGFQNLGGGQDLGGPAYIGLYDLGQARRRDMAANLIPRIHRRYGTRHGWAMEPRNWTATRLRELTSHQVPLVEVASLG